MENKLILTKEKSSQATKPALLEVNTHTLLKNLSAETGIPMIKLVSKCVAFALEHAVIVDSKDDSGVLEVKS